MKWKLILLFGIIVGVMIGGFLYYQEDIGVTLFDRDAKTVKGIISQAIVESKPDDWIGESGFGWEFNITEDKRHEISLEVYEIEDDVIELLITEHPESKTKPSYNWSMALCNTEGADLKYENEKPGGGFDNTFSKNTTYGKLTDVGMNETWCGGGDGYIIFGSENKTQFPKKVRLSTGNMTNFKLYAGTGSVLIDAAGNSDGTAFLGNNICMDSSGVLHVGYEGADADLWYGNSTNNGTTWSTKEILAGSVQKVDITCGTNNNITIVFDNGADVDGFESGDSGETWSSIFTVFDTAGGGGFNSVYCSVDSNNIVHCVSDHSTDAGIYYTNSSTYDTETFLAGQASNDTEDAVITIDVDDNIYIIGIGPGEDDFDIWSSKDAYASRNTITDALGAYFAGRNGGIAMGIDTDGSIWVAGAHNTDLNICNATTSGWNGGWTCRTPSLDESRAMDVGISLVGDIFFIATSDNELAASVVLRTNSSNNGTSWESRTEINPASSAFPSMAYSLFPTANRLVDTLHYVFTNATGVYYDSFAVRTAPAGDTCTCDTSGNWDVTASDNCVLSSECTMDGSDFICSGVGTFTFDADLLGYSDLFALGGCNLTCRSGCFI